jgi:hypothetical protein
LGTERDQGWVEREGGEEKRKREGGKEGKGK